MRHETSTRVHTAELKRAERRREREHLQKYVGMWRQHVDVVLTERIHDDGFTPVYQLCSDLKDLWRQQRAKVDVKLVHLHM